MGDMDKAVASADVVGACRPTEVNREFSSHFPARAQGDPGGVPRRILASDQFGLCSLRCGFEFAGVDVTSPNQPVVESAHFNNGNKLLFTPRTPLRELIEELQNLLWLRGDLPGQEHIADLVTK